MLFDIPRHRIESDGIRTLGPLGSGLDRSQHPRLFEQYHRTHRCVVSRDYRELFVVTPHCKNSNDPVRFQHLVDEAMLKIDAP